MSEIGATLREARMRARIDVSEIESQTKIRAKYLRALENEEWDLLPGPTYVKSFLKTYAQALDLDAKGLLEQYRLSYERPSDVELQPIMPASRRQREQRAAPRRGGTGFIAAVIVFLIVIVLAIYGIVSGGGSKHNPVIANTPVPVVHKTTRRPKHRSSTSSHTNVVSLQLRATSSVWVCLLARGNRTLINGVVLTSADAARTFRSSRFTMTLGNSSVALRVDGHVVRIPASSKPLSFSLSASGRHTISGAQAPTCA